MASSHSLSILKANYRWRRSGGFARVAEMQFNDYGEVKGGVRDLRHLHERKLPYLKLLFAALFCAVPAKAATLLSMLQPGATIVSGNLEFFNFRNLSQSGNLSVDPGSISVDPVTDGAPAPATEFGIRFSSALWRLTAPNLAYAFAIDYDVRTVSGLPLITDGTLQLTGSSIPNGSATVSEEVLDQLGNPLSPPVTNQVFFGDGGIDLADHEDFQGGPFTELEIRTDFTMSTGAAVDSRVFASHFDQTFSQIPESGTALLAAFSMLLVFGWTGRSRARQAVR
jgi:hypothetical protein